MLAPARKFFDDAEQQLRATDHFGILGPSLNPATAVTRADYAKQHCDLLMKLKTKVPGLGLGRQHVFPRDGEENEWEPLQELTGLDVCQAWAVLLNAGHLFGTFATERGLMFLLDRNLDMRFEFVEKTTAFDSGQSDDLRRRVSEILEQSNIYHIHYLLALWRLRAGGVSALSESDRLQAQRLVKAFIVRPSALVDQLVSIFRGTRQLVYMTLHNELRDARHRVQSLQDADLQELFPLDVATDETWFQNGRWEVLGAIDKHDSVHFFGSKQAAATVLAHAAAFKAWSSRNLSDRPFVECLDKLFVRPSDWPEEPVDDYESFATVDLPTRLDWLSEVRLWLRDSGAGDPWGKSNFLITPSPRSSTLKLDIYRPREGLELDSLRHIVVQLGRAFSAHSDGVASRAL